MLQRFTKNDNFSPRIEMVSGSRHVVARFAPTTDVASRRDDLKRLAQRYNAMRLERASELRIAQ
jgi:hypothetical protein